MKKILLLDNYDSFTYNIAHIVQECGYVVDIIRNDKISLDDVGYYDKIILSPGPGIPSEAGIMVELIKRYGATKSILGICLGHQAIGQVYGCQLENLSQVYHGVQSSAKIIASDALFVGMGDSFEIGRYHSWVVSPKGFSPQLQITAVEEQSGQIMALSHREYDVRGVQFHPESILTPQGAQIIKNWLQL